MLKLNVLVFLLLSILGVCIGQITQNGQCDPNIEVVENFNLQRFEGLWHDIESYPAPFQTGTCPKTEYTLIGEVLHLVNSQVQNQLLETFTGTATVASGDGSAKLEVNINGNNVASILWILSTDYDTYALAYSCTNLDGQTRAVQSWKLSRTTSLTPNAVTTINGLIENITALNQNEFIERSHTEQACFYFPDNNGGDVILNGQCVATNVVPAVTNFNADLFAGTWYEVSRFPSTLQADECVASQLVTNGTNTYNIIHTRVNNERQVTVNTEGTFTNGGRGVVTINAQSVPFTNIYVLATNYSEYALLYGCRNVNNQQKQIYSWKLSKSRDGLSNAANAAINLVVDSNNDLHEKYFRNTAQDNNACFYYPVFEQLPAYIQMPVPCPDNIRGVPDFKSKEYEGKWFETARYPTTYSRGQCNRAEYHNTNEPAVIQKLITFTSVLNETLVTELATARLAEDASGHLTVEVGDTSGVTRTFDYYILATDYVSYSLVYSCANIENGASIVSAWKLSKTATLTPEANAVINGVISSTRGIAEEYFQTTSQSDDACFYIPTLNPQQAPVFRGPCEEITGVVNFDINRYLGWWHDIESYPIVGTGNNCRSSRYSQEGSVYQVVDTVVRNNNGFTTYGTVTASTDGKLSRVLDGDVIQDIWVLATDYETYSLLYSCSNVDSEYRTVWSAIHSKTRDPISEAAKTTIAPIIANNRVLVENFYLSVNQSDEDCFHYPANSGGLIPGQCDLAIPVVQNFNATAFAGDWYHIERYEDAAFVSCVGSSYTVDKESSTINAINFEVRNDELQIVNGTATVVSTDGSARLQLRFPVGDSEEIITSVFILATDYNNYALAYSCDNVNAYQRQVRAWKLSRTRSLSVAGAAVINGIIVRRQELHQPYFQQIVQNDDCPDHNSAIILKTSFIMLFVLTLLHRLL